DGIRGFHVTGVQTCALPIWSRSGPPKAAPTGRSPTPTRGTATGSWARARHRSRCPRRWRIWRLWKADPANRLPPEDFRIPRKKATPVRVNGGGLEVSGTASGTDGETDPAHVGRRDLDVGDPTGRHEEGTALFVIEPQQTVVDAQGLGDLLLHLFLRG